MRASRARSSALGGTVRQFLGESGTGNPFSRTLPSRDHEGAVLTASYLPLPLPFLFHSV